MKDQQKRLTKTEDSDVVLSERQGAGKRKQKVFNIGAAGKKRTG